MFLDLSSFFFFLLPILYSSGWSLKNNLLFCLYVSVCGYVRLNVDAGDVGAPETGLTGGCERPDVGAGNGEHQHSPPLPRGPPAFTRSGVRGLQECTATLA